MKIATCAATRWFFKVVSRKKNLFMVIVLVNKNNPDLNKFLYNVPLFMSI